LPTIAPIDSSLNELARTLAAVAVGAFEMGGGKWVAEPAHATRASSRPPGTKLIRGVGVLNRL
jgi:hypothetical protein